MRYRFHPEAEIEFIKAIEYYEDQERELGLDFSIEVYKTVERILENPESWSLISKFIRRALVSRFPFGILYHYKKANNQVLIISVMHLRREPEYWKKRN